MKLIYLLLLIILGFILRWKFSNYFDLEFWFKNIEIVKVTIENNFVFSSGIFLVAHFIFSLLPMPFLSSFALLGGLFFSFKISIAYCSIAGAFGSTFGFLLFRYFLNHWTNVKFGKIKSQYLQNEKNNIWNLISFRLFPAVPYFVTTAIFSVSNISVFNFVWASFLGRLPIIIFYSYVGTMISKTDQIEQFINYKSFIIFVALATLMSLIKRRVMKKWIVSLAFIFLIFDLKVMAQSALVDYSISAVVSDESILIQNLAKATDLKVHDIFAIYSHETHLVLGYAEINSIPEHVDFFEANVLSHHRSGMIRAGNYLKKLNLAKTDNEIPAKMELLSYSDRVVAAKYRHLVYTGFFLGQTAQNLLKNEKIIGPSFLGYGFNNKLQLHSNLLNSFFGTPNIGFKYLFSRNDDYALSYSQEFNYYPDARRTYHEFSFHLDTYSNSKFVSYAKLKFFTKRPETKNLTNNEEYIYDLSTELQLAYGFLTDGWNRFIFGPKVDFQKKTVGGSIGYYFIDKEFHMLIGASANDFSEATLGRDGYILNLDFWWRF